MAVHFANFEADIGPIWKHCSVSIAKGNPEKYVPIVLTGAGG